MTIFGFQITGTGFLQFAGAIGLSAILAQLLQWFRERNKQRIDEEVAERTIEAHVDVTDVAALQSKLLYLQQIIDTQAKYHEAQSVQLTSALEREQRWRMQVFDLQLEVQQLKMQATEMQEKCEHLERKMVQLRAEKGDKNV